MTAVLAIIIAGLAGTAVALAIRNGGLKAEVQEADTAREQNAKQMQMIADEFADYKRRAEARIGLMEYEIGELETELASCAVPGAVRERLRRLLSEATDSEGGDRADTVP